MGSRLGPYFANTFLSFHEHNWIANCPPEFKPLFFCRYVDDCFAIFSSPDHVWPFHEYLNLQHPNISFTSEFENNSTLPFLDILIDRSNGFSTSVYRKPSFTGLFTHFDSFIPISYKCGLVNRYFKICSSYQLFHSELLNNGYPDTFLDSCIRVFLDKLFSQPTWNSNTPDKTVLNFSLPFTGSRSLQIWTPIAKPCSSAFPHVTMHFIFQSGRWLWGFFSFKDQIPKLMRSCTIFILINTPGVYFKNTSEGGGNY